jgi:hypothetical protein
MDKFTLEHQVDFYESYAKYNTAGNSQRKFKGKLPVVQVSHRNTIQNSINNVRTTAVLTDG